MMSVDDRIAALSGNVAVMQVFRKEVITGCNSVGRVRGLGPRCRTFEPCHSDQNCRYQDSMILMPAVFSFKATFVDLELMSVAKIVHRLQLCIDTRWEFKYEITRSKWEFDVEYVMIYKVNPCRVLIAIWRMENG